MRTFTEILVLLAVLAVAASKSHLKHYKNEGHSIMKRMAEAEEIFEEHDMAKVHLLDGKGQRKKRMATKDLRMLGKTGITNRLQLGLSSGSRLNLALTPANIGHSDTVVSYHTEIGYEERKRISTDCYFYGKIEDSTGIGWAAVSHCDGVFGFGSSPAYEYFFHPITSRRSKRDTGEMFDVHVLWRRAPSQNVDNGTVSVGNDDDDVENDDQILNQEVDDDMLAGYAENKENATAIVIELAMFSDERFWDRLHNAHPGREDDFLLTRLAGTQAMYGNSEKVGYDVKIKLKLLEYWKTNPVNYTFTQYFPKNLVSFCHYTAKLYHYDIHALNTGIAKWNNGQIGLAYLGGVCTMNKCFVLKGLQFKSFVGFGHELGHTLGLSHRNNVNCPVNLNTQGGFMGGGSSLLFAPCMKFKFSRFMKSGKGHCLLKEISESATPTEYQSVPSLFPGQARTPDGLCHILAGPEYKYLPNKRPFGSGVCLWFICLNEEKNSTDYLRARRTFAPMGFPCRAEGFCQKDHSCKLWNVTKMTLDPEYLRNQTKIPQWSEWSAEISPCSRSCGTGVRVRRRICQYADYNLALYCPGMPVKPELCNTEPCEGEPKTLAGLRHLRGDEVCERYFQNNVRLSMKKAKAYLPKGSGLTPDDTGANIPVGHSRSCLLKCVRVPKSATGELDAVMPDGTLCVDYRRPLFDLDRLNIQMRCLRGLCHEFSDCPDGRQIKDDCGICDGDGSRCFSLIADPHNIAKHHRAELSIIPSCSTNIGVYLDRGRGRGVVIELWSHDDKNIIGEDGQYPKADYEGLQAIEFAGTRWTYKPNVAYLRASGPTNETVKIIAYRKGSRVDRIFIKYAKSI